MDVTAVFKDCISRNQKASKDLDSILTPENNKHKANNDQRNPVSKSTVFRGKRSEHSAKAKDISSSITKLRDFLKEWRTPYVNVGASKHATSNSAVFQYSFSNHISSDYTPIMSDKERDQIDNDVQLIIHNCQKSIQDFQTYVNSAEYIFNQEQLHTHLGHVIDSLATYLKRVTEIYSEMRAIRVKRTVDYQAMSRLASYPTSSRGLKSSKSNLFSNSNKTSSLKSKSSEWETPTTSRRATLASESDGVSITGSNFSETGTTVPTYFEDEDDVLSPEELQILELENAALLNELNTLSQEVEQIESNVVQIAQLQEIFTEKVLQQERDIDRIGTMIVNTTENIRDGNEQVRQAIQKSADFRAWVLFFIMVMSFSLLFLDWYND